MWVDADGSCGGEDEVSSTSGVSAFEIKICFVSLKSNGLVVVSVSWKLVDSKEETEENPDASDTSCNVDRSCAFESIIDELIATVDGFTTVGIESSLDVDAAIVAGDSEIVEDTAVSRGSFVAIRMFVSKVDTKFGVLLRDSKDGCDIIPPIFVVVAAFSISGFVEAPVDTVVSLNVWPVVPENEGLPRDALS